MNYPECQHCGNLFIPRIIDQNCCAICSDMVVEWVDALKTDPRPRTFFLVAKTDADNVSSEYAYYLNNEPRGFIVRS